MSERGFTIIELLIATAVFAIVLVITTTSLISISDTYIKGQVEGQTQATARSILSDISQDIEFNDPGSVNTEPLPFVSSLDPWGTTDEYYFCVGSDVYVYNLNNELSTTQTGTDYSNWGLIRYSAATCPSSLPVNTMSGSIASYNKGSVEELMSTNERLGELSVVNLNNTNTGCSAAQEYNGSSNTFVISIEIGYGDTALLGDTSNNYTGSCNSPLDTYSYTCQSEEKDSNFCSVATLTTTVQSRITSN